MNERTIERAKRLIATKGHLIRLQQDGYNWFWFVPSQSEPGKEYQLPFDASTCPCDWHQFKGAVCTHMTAARITRVQRARWESAKRKREGLQDLRPKTKDELRAIAERLGI
jgi:hypothetical protein